MLRYAWPSDDEQLAGQAVASYFDEDGSWWSSVQQCGTQLALVAALGVALTTGLAAQAVFSQSQDDPAGSLQAQPLVYEEYWQNPVAPVNWPQPAAITYDDTHVAFVNTFEPDEDFWQNPVPPVQAANFVNLPFLDPEELPVGSFPPPSTTLDDGGLWAPQIPPQEVDWILQLFLDDGSWVPALQPDEDFWPSSASPLPVNWPQPAQPFAASDEDNEVPQFVAAEDPVWLQLVPPLQASLQWPQQWPFEQNDPAGSLSSFTDENFWQNPVSPVPDSIWLLRQDLFEQNDATGSLFLDLDEGLSGPLPAPVQATNLLLQQWPFEQNEPAGNLTTIHEEDFWNNPVAPVIWPQPSVFTYDDVAPSPPNTGQDEDFWSFFAEPFVAPVPPSLYVRMPYLPDVEEIPAGSLHPFVPPPPSFCPFPPGGPDADTNISVFSNFKGGPILALLCRICMSGNPLVVRGDYAIWCQDCCAFVSKQDTYMGTVRAPGQFRARF